MLIFPRCILYLPCMTQQNKLRKSNGPRNETIGGLPKRGMAAAAVLSIGQGLGFASWLLDVCRVHVANF